LGEDPIHAGILRAWLSPDMEIYFYTRDPAENLPVLAYARDSKPGQGMLWPVEWTTTYGIGRVCVFTCNHVWKGGKNTLICSATFSFFSGFVK
jgi:type 1 glutamine amidotransferase